jgi:hypothetical protein
MSIVLNGTGGTITGVPGQVLQVVNGTTITSASSSSTTWADTTLTASITPTSSSNKILVLVSQNGMRKGTTSVYDDISIRLLRNATSISQPSYFAGYTNSSLQFYGLSCSLNYLDSPTTTSSTTYKTQISNPDGSGAVSAQYSGEMSTITLMEIAA